MKAAVVSGRGEVPKFGDFEKPTAEPGEELIAVRACALTHLTKGRAAGSHYSAGGGFPAVAGSDGVGVTEDGRRVYFALPRAPFGAMAEFCVVPRVQCIDIPDELDDVAAAALGNPGMSAWAALVERAKLVKGETVLVNGATGAAGQVAVRLAKFLGASRVIVTGRNADALGKLDADRAVPFVAGEWDAFADKLEEVFAAGIDVVVDYLWGDSAKSILVAIAKGVEDARPVRFVQVGSAGGQESLALPAAALRSSSVVLMGSGLKSVPLEKLIAGTGEIFRLAHAAGLAVETEVVGLDEVETRWNAEGKARVVFTV